jgi:hypothetical protein
VSLFPAFVETISNGRAVPAARCRDSRESAARLLHSPIGRARQDRVREASPSRGALAVLKPCRRTSPASTGLWGAQCRTRRTDALTELRRDSLVLIAIESPRCCRAGVRVERQLRGRLPRPQRHRRELQRPGDDGRRRHHLRRSVRAAVPDVGAGPPPSAAATSARCLRWFGQALCWGRLGVMSSAGR